MPRKSRPLRKHVTEGPLDSDQELRSQLANNVRKFRTVAGLTQQQLGERSGLSIRYISQIEKGLQNLTLDSMNRISKALNIQLTELITGVTTDTIAAKKLVDAIPLAIHALQTYLEIMKKSESIFPSSPTVAESAEQESLVVPEKKIRKKGAEKSSHKPKS